MSKANRIMHDPQACAHVKSNNPLATGRMML
jgi:hypothetical protein